jgi:integrative and conjugative element protein (TIGR02256 family)
LKKILKARWEKKQYYLGEWHFHPNASPNPSGQDKRQLMEIANNASYNCPEPIMIIIGGTSTKYALEAFMARRNSQEISEMRKCNDISSDPSTKPQK